MSIKKIMLSLMAGIVGATVMSVSAMAQETDSDIYKIGEGQEFETLEAARLAARDTDGDGEITYEIYGKVSTGYIGESIAFVPGDTTDITTINFVGADDTAELYIPTRERAALDGGFNANYKINVNVTNLICARPDGDWSDNFADGNNHFLMLLSHGNTLTYTNCKFPNGVASNMKGTTIFEGCEFDNQLGDRTKQQYALWAYASNTDPAVVEVNDCTFNGTKGVKVYTDDHTAAGGEDDSVTITNSEFNITGEPALVSSSYSSVELNENEYTDNGYGIVASENGKGTITIDGEAPAFVASAPDMWGTVYNVQTQKYAEALLEEAKGGNPYGQIPEDKLVINYPVAMVKTTSYTSLNDALAALEEGDTLMLATGEYEGFDILVDDVTITGMTDDTVITITAVPGNAFIGVNADGVSIEDLTFVVSEGYTQTGNYLDGFDAVIGYWSKNFDAGSRVTTGYDVKGCTFINESTTMGVAMFNFSSFEITGNAFENFNVGIHTMSDNSAMGDIVISGNTFTKVNEPVNVYWGQNGGEDDSIEITNNDFVSAKDADEIKLTVHDLASAQTGTAGINEIDLSGNTYSVATEVVLVDAASDVSEDAKEDLANAENVTFEAKYVAVARIGEDKYFTTLDAAITAANPGDTIELLGDAAITEAIEIKKNITIDLAGNTLTMSADTNTAGFYPELRKCSYYINANVTFKNGDMVVSNESHASHGNFFVEVNKSLTFDNVVLTTDGINAFALIQTYGDLNFVNGTEVAINGIDGNFIYSEENLGDVAITDSEITLENVGGGITGSGIGLNITDSVITMNDVDGKAFANINGTIEDTVISVTGAREGIANTIGTVNVTGDSAITIIGSDEFDLSLGEWGKLNIEDTASVTVENAYFAENSEITGDIVNKAEIVYVQFRKTDLDEENNDNNEKADIYEIVLAGYNAETINELASADFTFNFIPTPVTKGAMTYAVVGAKGVTVSRLGDSDRYMFNYNGVDKYEESGKAIVIGTIEVSGYGSYYLGIDETVDTNAVYATEIVDNVVDGFDPAADDLKLNLDMVEDDGMVGEVEGVEILVPTRDLTINIDFPNEAKTNNVVAYQQMTVTVSGGDLEEALVIKLGNVAEYTSLDTFTSKASENKAVSAVASDDAYDIVITDLLTLSLSYNVIVEGAGYRTARYTVTMTDDKELFFWNNVKDNETVIEKDKKSDKVTFLAGDIVKDNDINIYDLSAVVSYFGEEGLDASNHPEYAKYDLNRDGKIDSKDVAYVLVSWGN